jgi:hypothetical protein
MDESCLRCGLVSVPTQSPGTGPHYARLDCGSCGRFLRWLPFPPTPKQLAFLRVLGHTHPIPESKKQASLLIEELLEEKGAV